MRNWSSLLIALGILLAGNSARADESNFPTLETEYYYRKVYTAKPAHKAFAAGISGTFGTSWSYRSDKEAAKNAIASCRKGFARMKHKGGPDSKCHVVAIGNKLIAKDALMMPDWQVAATGIDQPLSSGVRHLIPEGKARGIVLYAQGCDGMFIIQHGAVSLIPWDSISTLPIASPINALGRYADFTKITDFTLFPKFTV